MVITEVQVHSSEVTDDMAKDGENNPTNSNEAEDPGATDQNQSTTSADISANLDDDTSMDNSSGNNSLKPNAQKS